MFPLRNLTLICAFGAVPALAQTSAPAGATVPAGQAGVARGFGSVPTPAPAPGTTVAVGVTRVVDNRNASGRGSLNLTLWIVGESLPPTAILRQVTVTGAQDNQGRNIGPSPTGPRGFNLQSALGIAALPKGRAGFEGSALLAGPVRDAESLKFVEGTIDLYLPSEATGSLVRIPNILSHSGRIEDPVLVKHGIEVRFYGDASSFAQAKRDMDSPGTMVAAPGGTALAANVPAAGPAIAQMAGLYVRDPSGRYGAYQLQNADGSPVPIGRPTMNDVSSGGWGQVDLVAPLPANAQLVIYLLVPDATKSLPFRVEGVRLP